jgi:hypothetical protein
MWEMRVVLGNGGADPCGSFRRVDDRGSSLVRSAACLAFSCLAVHLVLAIVGGTRLQWETTLMVALSAICATCGAVAWSDPNRRAALTLGLGG